MNKRELIGQLALLVLGALLGVTVVDTLINRDADRRFTIYNIMRELKRSATRQEVEAIIQRHDAPYLNKHADERGISLWVHLGFKTCGLTISFSNNLLEHASIRGEDGPHDLFKDAPPDI